MVHALADRPDDVEDLGGRGAARQPGGWPVREVIKTYGEWLIRSAQRAR